MTYAERYQQLNASFKPVLIWHVGVDAGFFAEYSAMLCAMLFCLERRWQFRLYSADANFGHSLGWTDYFAPFCPQETADFHHRYNLYALRSWGELLRMPARQRRQLVGWKLKLALRHAVGDALALKTYGHRVRLSHHVHFEADRHFSVPELDIDGDYYQAFSRLVDVTWHFNEGMATECQRLIDGLHLPAEFAGCQVRGGDKVTETELLPPERYADILRQQAGGREVFVLTDDYAIFTRLQAAAPEIHFHTLCEREEAGYVNRDFVHTDATLKRRRMVRFLTSMELLRRARPFVGSITPGPSLFILKLRYPDGIAIDCPREQQHAAMMLPIAGRSRIANANT